MDEKLDLITKVQEVAGRVPPGLIEVLNLLAHPSIIGYARAYLEMKDGASRCQIFPAPWDCAKEDEAKNETIAINPRLSVGTYLDNDQWCDVCRAREEEKLRRLHGIPKA